MSLNKKTIVSISNQGISHWDEEDSLPYNPLISPSPELHSTSDISIGIAFSTTSNLMSKVVDEIKEFIEDEDRDELKQLLLFYKDGRPLSKFASLLNTDVNECLGGDGKTIFINAERKK